MAMQQNYYADFSATGSTVDPTKSREVLKAVGGVVGPPVARNAMRPLGTWGAINIRFLFGFPFSPVHCYRVVEKMQVQSQPELVSLAEGVGVRLAPDRRPSQFLKGGQALTVVQQPGHQGNRGDTSSPAACLAERLYVDSNRRD
jgi:hypothetical protein